MKREFLWIIAAIFLLTASKPNDIALTVASFNLRFNNPADGKNAWSNRKEIVIDFLEKKKIDIFGIQEGLHGQLVDITLLAPHYAFIGVGREDGKQKGEYSAVVYNKKRFRPVASNTYWLHADTTAIGEKGWDGACERIVTWALMEEIKTGKRFYFINTHFDHIGKIARAKSSELLVNKVKEKGTDYPVIVTGDFNADPQSNVYEILTQLPNSQLIDSRATAKKISGTPWTFHAFGTTKLENRPIIDYIFVTQGTQVEHYDSVFEDHKGVYLSDHNPIVAKIKTKK